MTVQFNGKVYSTVDDIPVNRLLAPYMAFAAITPGTPFPLSRAIFADAAGHADITDANGDVVTGFPLVAGENRLMITEIANLVGATKVFAAN